MIDRRPTPYALAATLAGSLLAAALLGGCVAHAAPHVTPTRDPGMGTCDPVLLTGTTDEALTVTAQPLEAAGFPFAELAAAGDPVTCTAQFTVAHPDARVARLGVGLVNTPIAELTGQLDALAADRGWVRDPDSPDPAWRDADGGVLEAIEIEEGVLVTIAAEAAPR